MRLVPGWCFTCFLLGIAFQSFSEMSLKTDGSRLQMQNGSVRLMIEKDGGQLVGLFYKGSNLIGEGKGYVQSYDENGFMSPTMTDLIIARDDEEVIDVGFKHKHSFAVDYEFHYVLRPDEPGFYSYIVWGPQKDNRDRQCLKQLNYALRLDPNLFTSFFDGTVRGALPLPSILADGKKVMDASYELADGAVYTKYDHSAVMNEDHAFHGLMGAEYGAWVIMPSHEHLNGVPFNTELTLHQTGTTPILLRHVQAAHHGSGIAEFTTEDEPWQKWGGPWFYYFNDGGSMESREQEAQALSEKLVSEWPFGWIEDARFPVERGALRGRLVDPHGGPVGNARIILCKAAADESAEDFQQLWRGYRFFGWTDEGGVFELNKVWPDDYNLFALKDDVPGHYVHRDLNVKVNQTEDAGTLIWPVPATGRRLWQVGVLDRSAAEFAYGDDFRQWGLWLDIAEAYPKGVITINADTGCAGDIPHMLAAYTQKDGTPYHPVLRIEFNVPKRPEEKTASLLIALADAIEHHTKSVDLSLLLNEEPLMTITGKFKHGGAIHRSGIRGWCQEETICFDTSRLQVGKNVLEIQLQPPDDSWAKFEGAPSTAILFDALRLELK